MFNKRLCVKNEINKLSYSKLNNECLSDEYNLGNVCLQRRRFEIGIVFIGPKFLIFEKLF